MRTVPILICAATLIITFSSGVQAEYYRWIDSNGVTHFADKPQTPNSKTVEFRDTTVIPMADNNQRRGNRIQSLEPKGHRGSSRQNRGRLAAQRTRSDADQIAQKKNCKNYEDRIDSVESRLRAGGYSAPTGNRLRRERRELTSKRAWQCLRR